METYQKWLSIILAIFVYLIIILSLDVRFLLFKPSKRQLEKDRKIDLNLRNSGLFDDDYKEIDLKPESIDKKI